MASLNEKWKSRPVDYRIDYNAVHVWRCRFQASPISDGTFVERLSAEEVETAQRFVRQADHDRYISAHALLRSILGAYVGCAPQRLVFETSRYRKPFLVSPDGGKDIQFNLSHSRDIALIAVARGTAVGIDVEYMRTVPDAHEIVDRLFSINERQFLNSVSPTDFMETFFACWTIKEAFLKGIGKGLSYPLDKFSVSFSNGKPDDLIYHKAAADCQCWKIIRLSPGAGYSGAIAVEAPASELKCFEYYGP